MLRWGGLPRLDKPRFNPPSAFYPTLRQRVRQVLAEQGRSEHGGYRIVLKTVAVFALLITSYALLIGWASQWWHVVLLGVVLSQAIAMVGFNVMHDAGHGSFSRSGRVNRIMGFGLDLVGGSIKLWRHKHGVLHHSYPNLADHDDDLDTNGLLRLHPDQPWRPHQRFQTFYALPVYSLLALNWVVSDVGEFFGRRIGKHPAPAPSRSDTIAFVAFKLQFIGWMIVVPLLLHPWFVVVPTALGVMLLVGLTSSIVFQLAHVSDAVECPSPDALAHGVDSEWAVHQLNTTVDFSPRHPLLGLYLGGLNHQVIHHLFPRISHVHYARLQPVVAQTCAEFGVRYRCHPTLWAALAAHFRQLRRLAEPPGDAVPSATSQRV